MQFSSFINKMAKVKVKMKVQQVNLYNKVHSFNSAEEI